MLSRLLSREWGSSEVRIQKGTTSITDRASTDWWAGRGPAPRAHQLAQPRLPSLAPSRAASRSHPERLSCTSIRTMGRTDGRPMGPPMTRQCHATTVRSTRHLHVTRHRPTRAIRAP